MNKLATPWDFSDNTEEIVAPLQVCWVSTPSHGGLMIHADYALKHLSNEARRRGEMFGQYYCYEEDCLWAVATHELRDLWPLMFRKPAGQVEDSIMRTLSRWNPDYLLETGKKPRIKEMQQWQNDQLNWKMREAKHPDLIIAAWGADPIEGATKVMTADRKEHYVTAESYANWNSRPLNLLSDCVRYEP